MRRSDSACCASSAAHCEPRSPPPRRRRAPRRAPRAPPPRAREPPPRARREPRRSARAAAPRRWRSARGGRRRRRRARAPAARRRRGSSSAIASFSGGAIFSSSFFTSRSSRSLATNFGSAISARHRRAALDSAVACSSWRVRRARLLRALAHLRHLRRQLVEALLERLVLVLHKAGVRRLRGPQLGAQLVRRRERVVLGGARRLRLELRPHLLVRRRSDATSSSTDSESICTACFTAFTFALSCSAPAAPARRGGGTAKIVPTPAATSSFCARASRAAELDGGSGGAGVAGRALRLRRRAGAGRAREFGVAEHGWHEGFVGVATTREAFVRGALGRLVNRRDLNRHETRGASLPRISVGVALSPGSQPATGSAVRMLPILVIATALLRAPPPTLRLSGDRRIGDALRWTMNFIPHGAATRARTAPRRASGSRTCAPPTPARRFIKFREVLGADALMGAFSAAWFSARAATLSGGARCSSWCPSGWRAGWW